MFDAAYTCTNNEECSAAIVAIASAVGASASATRDYIETYNSAYDILAGEQQGEEHWIDYYAPPGYKVCALYWKPWPNGAAAISGSILDNAERVSFYAWARQNEWLEGGTSVEGLVQIFVVKKRYYPVSDGCHQTGVVFDTNNGTGGLQGGKYACKQSTRGQCRRR